jgi:hypothetical protein
MMIVLPPVELWMVSVEAAFDMRAFRGAWPMNLRATCFVRGIGPCSLVDAVHSGGVSYMGRGVPMIPK